MVHERFKIMERLAPKKKMLKVLVIYKNGGHLGQLPKNYIWKVQGVPQ